MKKKELQEARAKTIEEVAKAVQEKRGQIPLLTLELKMGKHGNLRVVKNAKRELAQLKAILGEKERLEKKQ
ncbi:MAG: 50S ribosomal protein L29 [bacterium]|nr:50S ribosomal protein L29 [bacterium]